MQKNSQKTCIYANFVVILQRELNEGTPKRSPLHITGDLYLRFEI